MEKSKILLVDDLSANIRAMENILKPLNVSIMKAYSGEEALKLLLHHTFAVIVLDVQMPGMDGFETAQLIRHSKNGEYTPIIFVTAIDRDNSRIVEAYGSGAVDYLFKPIDPIQLRNKIKIFLSLDEQRNALHQHVEKERQLRTLSEKQNKKLKMQSKLWLTVGSLTIVCAIFLSYNFHISKENIRLEEVNEKILDLNHSYRRFVPHEFVSLLGKKGIEEVKLGDQIIQAMAIMFFDMAGFTPMTAQMSSKEIITLMNEIFSSLHPAIEKNKGIVNKYLGDGAMVVFPGGENDATKAALDMMTAIGALNKKRIENGLKPLSICIGIDSGPLILGTVGEEKRLEHTVYGNTVNVASRVEGLTRKYGVNILITENIYSRINHEIRHQMRVVDNVRVKGRPEVITIYEFFGGDKEVISNRQKTLSKYENAFKAYQNGNFREAVAIFKEIKQVDPSDNLVEYHLAKCEQLLKEKPKNWSPIENFTTK